MAKLCDGVKLEIGAGTGLICQYYEGIIGSKAIAFTKDGVGDVQADLSVAEGAVNIEVTKDLFCFVCNDRGGNKVSLGVTNPAERETFLTVFFQRLGL